MPADSSNCMAECSRRLYMESSNAEEPTFCLDFYRTGASPGINAFGKGGVKLPTVLLYRVLDNKIDHIWIAPDKEEICNARALNSEKVRNRKDQIGFIFFLVLSSPSPPLFCFLRAVIRYS